ncbi:hypothetical protein LTR53_013199 [Teratosphaeriaceae sp. CCFEE 6253]|nr:hypothetical protein LTR53_013199 [Teratosphaeriaceae sp. CCFEE 6253]
MRYLRELRIRLHLLDHQDAALEATQPTAQSTMMPAWSTVRPRRHSLIATGVNFVLSICNAVAVILVCSAVRKEWLPWWAILLEILMWIAGGMTSPAISMQQWPSIDSAPLALLSSVPVMIISTIVVLIQAAAEVSDDWKD